METPQAQQPQPGVKRLFPRYDHDLSDKCNDEQRAYKWLTTFTASSPHRTPDTALALPTYEAATTFFGESREGLVLQLCQHEQVQHPDVPA
ncbi:hypothetical protein M422DRAFT_248061 [Sphaerobolus stellatus SS14]|nr:hypothetical protein M422DRAFT_248061 [Sphaerobolus stellatus SS14]